MAPKPADPRKQKEAKQKKLLLLLVPVLAILLVLQGPKLLKVVNGGDAKTEAAPAETAPASTDPATTPPDPSAADPATVLDPVALAGTAILTDSDVPPPADEGQLTSFGRFVGKDLFAQLVEPAPSQEDQPPAEDASGTDDAQPGDGDGDSSDAEPETPNTAELTVNGVAESVTVGGSFPASDPIFRLAEIDGEVAKIGLVTGSFSTGDATLDLKVGETLTLVSQPDGIRYQIKLLNVLVGSADSSESSDTTDTTDTTDGTETTG